MDHCRQFYLVTFYMLGLWLEFITFQQSPIILIIFVQSKRLQIFVWKKLGAIEYLRYSYGKMYLVVTNSTYFFFLSAQRLSTKQAARKGKEGTSRTCGSPGEPWTFCMYAIFFILNHIRGFRNRQNEYFPSLRF